MILRTYIKKYPAEYHSQSAIDAAEQIVAERGGTVRPEEVESLEIATFRASWEIIGKDPEKWRPQSRETADHSLPYITCAALVDGGVTHGTFEEARFKDEGLLAMVSRTAVVPDEGLDSLYPERGIPNRLTLKLSNGQTWTKRVDAPRGHALNPMSDDEVVAKCLSMASPLFGQERAQAAVGRIWALEDVRSVSELFDGLVVE
jgi:2-methylcitrate dehydratase